MNKIDDFNIRDEILPLFNFSLNNFTKNQIIEILETPLSSINEIEERQNLFKGFKANNKILIHYSYTVLYLNEVHFFLNDEHIEDFSIKPLKFKFLYAKREKLRLRNKLNQLIIFFHRLESKYFLRLDIDVFPSEYISTIRQIIEFLSIFQLNRHEKIVREYQLKDKDIIELTNKIHHLKTEGSIRKFWNNLFLFEAYLSISRGIEKNNFVFPKIKQRGIKIEKLYHPLLKQPVKNDISTDNNVILMNGPNMSGKSTFLKSVGLCMYLGHLGIGIPASKGEIPFVENFTMIINRQDNIQNGYSHFMTEIMNLKDVIKDAASNRKCFAIFDELFSGTNVEDGYEICKTTLNGLSKFENSYFFISTHIQELKNIENKKISNFHIDCELINGKPTFTYKLKKGWSDIKVGRILFEKEGLNDMLQ